MMCNVALVSLMIMAAGVVADGNAGSLGLVAAGQEESAANPIRRVVSLLQGMAKKVAAEGEAEAALHDKYMCWCKTSGSDLQKSIAENNAKIPQVQADIEAAVAAKATLEEELKGHQEGRAAAKDAQAKATAIREKEATAFKKEAASLGANIDALNKAIPAIEHGMSGFLQTSAASLIRRVAVADADLSEFDRDSLASFLAGGSTAAGRYVPQSAQIVGILKTMNDEFQKDLGDLSAQEAAAKANYEAMMAALTKEIAAHTEAIEKKTQRVGDLGVEIANMKNDLSDSEAALVSDTKFLQDMEKNCATKSAEWEERSATRTDELLAIHETIKILNDDDALELFKKTLPSPSLLQVRAKADRLRSRVLSLMSGVRAALDAQHKPNVDMIALALSGKQVDFSGVMKMIDDLVATLKKEQATDDAKKAYCGKELDQVEDTIKEQKRQLSDLETSIAAKEETLKTIASEIEVLQDGIKALDKQVAEATEQRKTENAEYTELMSSNSAAKELIEFAKNRLNKFYNPRLHKPAPKRELADEAPALVQISQHGAKRDAPPPAPETFGEYTKKTEESGGVIAMMDLLVKELVKEMTEAQANEEHAQKSYAEMMGDSSAKRAADASSITEKEAAKAETETSKEADEEAKASTTKEFLAAGEYQQQLHAECDWLVQNYDLRKTARADEVTSLNNAKAVLAGADFS